MRASADSEMPAACASIAKRAFSPAEGRTVIEAGVVPEAPLMTDGLMPSSRSSARPQQAKHRVIRRSAQFWQLTPPSAGDCARFAELASPSFGPFGPNTSLFFGAN
jgi:hypothetical protein